MDFDYSGNGLSPIMIAFAVTIVLVSLVVGLRVLIRIISAVTNHTGDIDRDRGDE